MNIGDIVVVSVGLLAGWSIVSIVLRKSETKHLRTLGKAEISDNEIRNSWPEILRVSRTASMEEIDSACKERLGALRRSFPAVMTDLESQQYDRGTTVLRRASDVATRGGEG